MRCTVFKFGEKKKEGKTSLRILGRVPELRLILFLSFPVH